MIPYRLNPLGITVNENLPLTFTAEQAGSTVQLTKTGSPTVSGLHYRLGKSGAWLAYTIGDTITLSSIGDSVQFWNSNSALSTSDSDYVRFAMTGLIASSGNILSLLNYSEVSAYCFYDLFHYATSLTSLAGLPSLQLAAGCYNSLCRGCTRLQSVKLPFTSFAAASCVTMFAGCSSLVSIEVAFTSWPAVSIIGSWVSGVAAEGTFIKPSALSENFSASRIPSGWTVVNK